MKIILSTSSASIPRPRNIRPDDAYVVIAFDGYKKNIPVKQLDHASYHLSRVRDDYGFGSSNMLPGCGNVIFRGKQIARISYNGRIWDMQDKEITLRSKKAKLPIGTFEI